MDNIISIHYNSDWEFEYPLPASYDNCPFKITLYTIDYEDNRYEAYFDGTSYVNCTKTNNNSIIVHIDNFTFYPGCVRVRVEYFIDSASFNDGIYNGVHTEKTNIYTTKAKSATTAITFEGSSLPNFDAVNIANNVETALNDINEKSEEVEEALSYLSEAQEQVDSILEELNSWVEDNSDLVHRPELSYYALVEDLAPFVTEDEMSDWLSRDYYTKTEVDDAISNHIPDIDLSSYVTKEQLSAQSYLTQHQSLDGYVTDAELADNLAAYATKDYLDGELSSYVSYSYLEGKQYLTQHQSLSEYASIDWVHAQNYVTLEYMDEMGNVNINLDGYVKYADVDFNSYVMKDQLSQMGYITSDSLSQMGYLTQHQDLSNYALKTDIPEQLWIKGYAEGSIKIAFNNNQDSYGIYSISEGCYCLASGDYSHAEGYESNANGISSHAEGYEVRANGAYSHAEGYSNQVDGMSSHGEGYCIMTNNFAEHAEGCYNVSNIGNQNAGNSITWFGTGTYTLSSIGFGSAEGGRRNAFEVMQNGDIYAYGVGNYDGTNPEAAYTLKETVDNLSERIDNITVENIDLSSYVSKDELSNCGYLTSHQSLDDYATKAYVLEKVSGIGGNVDLSSYVSYDFLSSQSYITSNDFTSELNRYYTAREIDDKLDEISSGGADLTNYPTYAYLYSYVENALETVNVDLSSYATLSYTNQNYPTYAYVEGRYLKYHQPLTDYATKAYVMDKINSLEINGGVDLTGYVSKAELSAQGYLTSHQSLNGYATEQYVTNAINNAQLGGGVDLSDYVTKVQLSNAGYLTSHQSLDNYITKAQLSAQSYLTQHQSLSEYATKAYVLDKINDIEQVSYNVSYTGTITQTISIWQGTQAQYNALSNYTTYQLYLIAQS